MTDTVAQEREFRSLVLNGTKLKLCVNCKWLRESDRKDSPSKIKFAKCFRPSVRHTKVVTCLVSGDISGGEQLFQYCSVERESGVKGDCGPDGIFFEPKE